MTPGKINGATRVLGAPDKWNTQLDGECAALYVRDHVGNGPRIQCSVWYPTPEELERLNRGEPVVLSVWGGTHPPVSLNVPGGEKNNGDNVN